MCWQLLVDLSANLPDQARARCDTASAQAGAQLQPVGPFLYSYQGGVNIVYTDLKVKYHALC